MVHTQKAKKVLGYQVAKHFLRFLCMSRQSTESGISGRRKFLATFKGVSPKYTFRLNVGHLMSDNETGEMEWGQVQWSKKSQSLNLQVSGKPVLAGGAEKKLKH